MPMSRSVRKMRTAISPRFATRTFENITVFSRRMGLADQLTVTRAVAVPIVVALYAISFTDHDYWATGVFCVAMATDWFDGRIARRTGRTSQIDTLLVLTTLIVLLEQRVFPAWMVAAIVARELLISALRQAAIERGVVIAAR